MSPPMSSSRAVERFQSANSSLIDSFAAFLPDNMLDEGNLTSGITFTSVQLLPSLNATESDTQSSTNSSVPATVNGFADTLRIVKISLLAVIFVLILCGNVFVLLALNNRKLKMNRMYFFLVHLSIADLITGFFNVLPQLAWEAAQRFYGGNVLCKVVKFLQILGPYLSSYVLVMTSIDRYQAICHPLTNSSNKSKSRSRWMVLGAWLISLASCSPQLAIFSYVQIDKNVYECWAHFPHTWMPGAYVTFYTVTVFIVPFCILTYTHIIICHEIWLNWHSKRQSLMVKDHHSTRPKPVGAAKESYLVANSTSNSSSGLRLEHHALPHSPLPGSKGSRHSLAASTHFFAKTPREPLDTTTALNRHVSSKCSRTLNRLLWICNKSHSVSSNSSAVSTSTNSSASSHRSCSPHHRHSHRHSHSRHHHSALSLALPNLCPVHDKPQQTPTHRLSCEEGRVDHNGFSTAADIVTRSTDMYRPAVDRALLQGESFYQKEVQLRTTKVLPSGECGDDRQLMRHAKSESELWFERQRKQIRRKRRKLHLIDSIDTGAPWSSSSSSSVSDSSEDSEPTERKTSVDTSKMEAVAGHRSNRGDSSRLSRHRRNTLSTVTSNMRLHAKMESGDIISSPSNQIYLHQVNCPCARCTLSCRCPNGFAAQLSTKQRTRKASTESRSMCKVLKPATSGKLKSENAKSDNVFVLAVMEGSENRHSIDKAQPYASQSSGLQCHLNSTTVDSAIDQIEAIQCDSVPKLNSAQKSSVDLTSANPVYSPVYDFEDKHFALSSGMGPRGSDSHSEPKSNYPVNKLTHSTSTSASTGPGSANVLVPRNYQINRNKQTRLSNPRIHSMQGLTRAKIKTVKITLVVITCYVICSSPFIGVQLWAQFWPGAQETAFWRGPMIAILMLLPSLNAVCNPWIYIYFNPNLVSSFCSLFTRKSSSNSNLHSIGGGKNYNGNAAPTGAKNGRGQDSTIFGHRPLHKMLTNDSAECSNSMDSRSMRDNSRLDLISAAKETQGHARSASTNFRANHLHQMKSCGTATDISVVTSIEDNNSTVTTVTTSTNKLQPVSVYHPTGHHHHGHNHLGSNLSSMSNLNEENDTVATYESTVTLSTNSTVTTAGGSLRHPRMSYKSKSVVAAGFNAPGKVRKPRRRISIQLDKMWNKISAPNKRSSPPNASSQIVSEQFIV